LLIWVAGELPPLLVFEIELLKFGELIPL
jgi:hypothetical protein